jgi:TonB family protein
VRRISLSTSDAKRIRFLALLTGALAHVLPLLLLVWLEYNVPEIASMLDLTWRGGGGGGGGGLKLYEVEFGPQSGNQTTSADVYSPSRADIMNIETEHFGDVGTPVIHQEKPPPKAKKKKKEQLYGENLPTKHRRGAGPGEGGGTGGGTGGGIGKSSGYSIDWGGTGSRRLLSGRLPKYPEGTTKEMPVSLQFTVLPDGSVVGVIPLLRSDELLENAAITALRTWRFDPLPQEIEQKSQIGKITFLFKLE